MWVGALLQFWLVLLGALLQFWLMWVGVLLQFWLVLLGALPLGPRKGSRPLDPTPCKQG